MMRDDIQNHQAIFDSAAGRNLVAEHNLFAVVVHGRSENELTGVVPRVSSHQSGCSRATAARLKDGPTGEATRYFLHVLLRVSAINTERMQLHQFARVVFINAASLLLLLLRSLLLRVIAHQDRKRTTGRAWSLLWQLCIGTHAL